VGNRLIRTVSAVIAPSRVLGRAPPCARRCALITYHSRNCARAPQAANNRQVLGTCLAFPATVPSLSERFAKSASSFLQLNLLKGRNMNNLRRFIREEDGQDMVEYALLASFISIVAIAALRAIGPLVNAIYVRVQGALAP
jgi:Flp pilus assembly pilin Flp